MPQVEKQVVISEKQFAAKKFNDPSAPTFGPPQSKIPGSAPDMTLPYLSFWSFDASTLLKGVPKHE